MDDINDNKHESRAVSDKRVDYVPRGFHDIYYCHVVNEPEIL